MRTRYICMVFNLFHVPALILSCLLFCLILFKMNIRIFAFPMLPIKHDTIIIGLRLAAEEEAFSPDRFQGDIAYAQEDPVFQMAMEYNTAWWEKSGTDDTDTGDSETTDASQLPARFSGTETTQTQTPSAAGEVGGEVVDRETQERQERTRVGEFTQEEKDRMVSLGRREFLIEKGSKEETEALCLALDLLAALCYDVRLTQVCVCVCVCVVTSVCVCLCVCLSAGFVCLFVCLFVYVCVCSFICPPVCLFVCLSLALLLCLVIRGGYEICVSQRISRIAPVRPYTNIPACLIN
jgi:hypothetical protein